MTICIAAICMDNSNEYIVFSTDHMISSTMGEFEHTSKKYRAVGKHKNIVAMLAGNALLFERLVFSKKNEFDKVADDIYGNFRKERKDIIQREVLDKFDIKWDFVLEALGKQIPNGLVQNILEKVAEFRLKTAILVIGFKGDRAYLSQITETGIVGFRHIGFHAVGSGDNQAASTLLFQKHSKEDSLRETLYNVYKAKRNAEVARGVGKETDLLIMGKTGIKEIPESCLKVFKKIYEKELTFGKRHANLNKIDIEEVVSGCS